MKCPVDCEKRRIIQRNVLSNFFMNDSALEFREAFIRIFLLSTRFWSDVVHRIDTDSEFMNVKFYIANSVCFDLSLLIISTAFWIKHEYISEYNIDSSWYKSVILQRLSEVRSVDDEDRQLTTYTRQLTKSHEKHASIPLSRSLDIGAISFKEFSPITNRLMNVKFDIAESMNFREFYIYW